MYSRFAAYANGDMSSSTPARTPLVNVGEDAPFFEGSAVVGDAVKQISSHDFKNQYLVLLFYPFDFTGVCNSELVVVRDLWSQFKTANIGVVGISMDSAFSHQAWIKQDPKDGGLGALPFPLLSDFTKSISKSYGVVFPAKDCPLRATFIVDTKGKVRHVTVNDLPVARSVEETLRTVRAFQHFENNGEMCMAKWKPK